MHTDELSLDTRGQHVLDITAAVADFTHDASAGGDGLVSVFAPHATAGLALMETGAGSEPDAVAMLRRLLPRDDRYRHSHGSPGHGADHVLPVLVSPSLVVPAVGGALALGRWQRVVLVDLNEDNPRRTVRLSFVAG